jgi:hypothetical protein
MSKEKTYYCDIDIKFGGNSFEAKSKLTKKVIKKNKKK